MNTHPDSTKISIRSARLVDIPLLATFEREFRRDERELVLKENPKLKPYVQSSPARGRIVAK